MRSKLRSKHGRLAVTLAVLILLMGSGVSYGWLFGQNDSKILKERAKKYWNSKLTGDMITCYQLEEPDYRKKVPISVYTRTGTLVFKEVKIKDINISDDNATVTVDIKYFIPALGSKHVFPSEVKDKWKKIGSEWYHVPEKNGSETGHKKTLKERR